MRDETEKILENANVQDENYWDFVESKKVADKLLSLFKRKVGELRNLPKYKPTSDYTLSNMEYIKVSDLNKAITKLEEEK